jgi:hypothetical protein
LRTQTIKAEGFAPQGKREEQDLSGSLLLNSTKQTEPTGEVVSAECGAFNKAID